MILPETLIIVLLILSNLFFIILLSLLISGFFISGFFINNNFIKGFSILSLVLVIITSNLLFFNNTDTTPNVFCGIICNEFKNNIKLETNIDFQRDITTFIKDNNIVKYKNMNPVTFNDLIMCLNVDELSKLLNILQKYILLYKETYINLDTFLINYCYCKDIVNLSNKKDFITPYLNGFLEKLKICSIAKALENYLIKDLLDIFNTPYTSNQSIFLVQVKDIITVYVFKNIYKLPKLFVISQVNPYFNKGDLFLHKLANFIDTNVSDTTIKLGNFLDMNKQPTYDFYTFISDITVSKEVDNFNKFLNENNICYKDMKSFICQYCDGNKGECITSVPNNILQSIKKYLSSGRIQFFDYIDMIFPDEIYKLCFDIYGQSGSSRDYIDKDDSILNNVLVAKLYDILENNLLIKNTLNFLAEINVDQQNSLDVIRDIKKILIDNGFNKKNIELYKDGKLFKDLLNKYKICNINVNNDNPACLQK